MHIFFKTAMKLKEFSHLVCEEEMQDAPLRQAKVITSSGHFFKVSVVMTSKPQKYVNEFAFIHFALLSLR